MQVMKRSIGIVLILFLKLISFKELEEIFNLTNFN